MLDFLHQRSLDSLVGAGGGGEGDAMGGAAAEVAVVVGPDAGADTPAEVQQGAAFPAYASPEERQAEAEALRAALAAAAAGLLPPEEQQQLAVAAGPAPEDMPGMATGALAGGAAAAAADSRQPLCSAPALPRKVLRCIACRYCNSSGMHCALHLTARSSGLSCLPACLPACSGH